MHLLLHHLQALFGSTLCYCKNFYILHLNFSFSSCLFLSLLIVWSCSLSFYFCHFCSACGFIELLMNNFPPCSRHSFKASIPNLRLIISVSSQVLIKVQTKFFFNLHISNQSLKYKVLYYGPETKSDNFKKSDSDTMMLTCDVKIDILGFLGLKHS